MKTTVPLLITFLVGMLLIVSYFTPPLAELTDTATVMFDILAAIAFILGGGNLLMNHGVRIMRQQASWGYSAVAVAAFLLTLAAGFLRIGAENTPGRPGYWARYEAASNRTTQPVPSQMVSWAYLDVRPDGARRLSADLRGAAAGKYAVTVDKVEVGQITVNDSAESTPLSVGVPATGPTNDVQRAIWNAREGAEIRVGTLYAQPLQKYSRFTGDYQANGSLFWFIYQYGMSPLQSTMFALLAFFVASAAFRAFRARNLESVLLLSTAFLVLLGRISVGTWLTAGLPESGPLSFFKIPNLVGWIMSVFNTAGTRAIMIGISLGIASTSLKVLLGIDRAAVGGDKG